MYDRGTKVMKEERAVRVFKALGNPTRLAMVRRLAACKTDKEACGDLSAESYLSQPTLSHHFGRLIESGVIIESKLGTSKYYGLNHRLLESHGISVKKL
jgi:ArsR family transcriptional regulator, arsenate/arsenite/antimonite-responsive transcriptional repressor